MALFRIRVQLPDQPGMLTELTAALVGVRVVDVRVGRSVSQAVVAELTLQAGDPSTMNQVITEAGRRSPWVRLTPVPTSVEGDRSGRRGLSARRRVPGGCGHRPVPGATSESPRRPRLGRKAAA